MPDGAVQLRTHRVVASRSRPYRDRSRTSVGILRRRKPRSRSASRKQKVLRACPAAWSAPAAPQTALAPCPRGDRALGQCLSPSRCATNQSAGRRLSRGAVVTLSHQRTVAASSSPYRGCLSALRGPIGRPSPRPRSRGAYVVTPRFGCRQQGDYERLSARQSAELRVDAREVRGRAESPAPFSQTREFPRRSWDFAT